MTKPNFICDSCGETLMDYSRHVCGPPTDPGPTKEEIDLATVKAIREVMSESKCTCEERPISMGACPSCMHKLIHQEPKDPILARRELATRKYVYPNFMAVEEINALSQGFNAGISDDVVDGMRVMLQVFITIGEKDCLPYEQQLQYARDALANYDRALAALGVKDE